jgi:hypothetical protein
MKRTAQRTRRSDGDSLREEYQFDYSRAKRNRFASRMKEPVVAIVLDPDVAAVFDSSTKVNARLRSIIAERKERRARPRARTHRRRAG